MLQQETTDRQQPGTSRSRLSTDSAASDLSVWSLPVGEAAADADEPEKEPLAENSRSGGARVRFSQDSDELESSNNRNNGSQEFKIHIPTPGRKPPTRGERILASIMTGGRNGSSFHGLTGKPLLLVPEPGEKLGQALTRAM